MGFAFVDYSAQRDSPPGSGLGRRPESNDLRVVQRRHTGNAEVDYPTGIARRVPDSGESSINPKDIVISTRLGSNLAFDQGEATRAEPRPNPATVGKPRP